MHLRRTNEISPLNLIVTIMTINLSAVVELMVVDDLLIVPEGGMVLICINVTNSQQLRETDITLSFSVTEGNNFTSMFMSQVLHAFIAFSFKLHRRKYGLSNT